MMMVQIRNDDDGEDAACSQEENNNNDNDNDNNFMTPRVEKDVNKFSSNSSSNVETPETQAETPPSTRKMSESDWSSESSSSSSSSCSSNSSSRSTSGSSSDGDDERNSSSDTDDDDDDESVDNGTNIHIQMTNDLDDHGTTDNYDAAKEIKDNDEDEDEDEDENDSYFRSPPGEDDDDDIDDIDDSYLHSYSSEVEESFDAAISGVMNRIRALQQKTAKKTEEFTEAPNDEISYIQPSTSEDRDDDQMEQQKLPSSPTRENFEAWKAAKYHMASSSSSSDDDHDDEHSTSCHSADTEAARNTSPTNVSNTNDDNTSSALRATTNIIPYRRRRNRHLMDISLSPIMPSTLSSNSNDDDEDDDAITKSLFDTAPDNEATSPDRSSRPEQIVEMTPSPNKAAQPSSQPPSPKRPNHNNQSPSNAFNGPYIKLSPQDRRLPSKTHSPGRGNYISSYMNPGILFASSSAAVRGLRETDAGSEDSPPSSVSSAPFDCVEEYANTRKQQKALPIPQTIVQTAEIAVSEVASVDGELDSTNKPTQVNSSKKRWFQKVFGPMTGAAKNKEADIPYGDDEPKRAPDVPVASNNNGQLDDSSAVGFSLVSPTWLEVAWHKANVCQISKVQAKSERRGDESPFDEESACPSNLRGDDSVDPMEIVTKPTESCNTEDNAAASQDEEVPRVVVAQQSENKRRRKICCVSVILVVAVVALVGVSVSLISRNRNDSGGNVQSMPGLVPPTTTASTTAADISAGTTSTTTKGRITVGISTSTTTTAATVSITTATSTQSSVSTNTNPLQTNPPSNSPTDEPSNSPSSPPTNFPIIGDNCFGATSVSTLGVTLGSTIGSTLPTSNVHVCGLSLAGGNTGNGVWYTFTPEQDMAMMASTCSGDTTNFDTQLTVLSARADATESVCDETTASFSCMAANDEHASCGDGSGGSLVEWFAEAGVDYYILVHGYRSAEGDFALQLSGLDARNVNDVCNQATPIVVGEAYSGSTQLASVDSIAEVEAIDGFTPSSPGVWFQVDGIDGSLAVNVFFEETVGSILVYEGGNNCRNLKRIAGIRGSTVSWPADPASTYYIYVAGPPTTPEGIIRRANFDIVVGLSRIDVLPGAPINDSCSSAFAITTDNVEVVGSTRTASIDLDVQTCQDNDDPSSVIESTTSVHQTAPGVWYTMRGFGTTMIITTCHEDTNFDTKISVYRNSCDQLQCVAGNDNAARLQNCPDAQSALRFFADEDETYFIYVTGYGTRKGEFMLRMYEED